MDSGTVSLPTLDCHHQWYLEDPIDRRPHTELAAQLWTEVASRAAASVADERSTEPMNVSEARDFCYGLLHRGLVQLVTIVPSRDSDAWNPPLDGVIGFGNDSRWDTGALTPHQLLLFPEERLHRVCQSAPVMFVIVVVQRWSRDRRQRRLTLMGQCPSRDPDLWLLERHVQRDGSRSVPMRPFEHLESVQHAAELRTRLQSWYRNPEHGIEQETTGMENEQEQEQDTSPHVGLVLWTSTAVADSDLSASLLWRYWTRELCSGDVDKPMHENEVRQCQWHTVRLLARSPVERREMLWQRFVDREVERSLTLWRRHDDVRLRTRLLQRNGVEDRPWLQPGVRRTDQWLAELVEDGLWGLRQQSTMSDERDATTTLLALCDWFQRALTVDSR